MNSVAAHLLGLSWLNIELNFGNIGFGDDWQTAKLTSWILTLLLTQIGDGLDCKTVRNFCLGQERGSGQTGQTKSVERW